MVKWSTQIKYTSKSLLCFNSYPQDDRTSILHFIEFPYKCFAHSSIKVFTNIELRPQWMRLVITKISTNPTSTKYCLSCLQKVQDELSNHLQNAQAIHKVVDCYHPQSTFQVGDQVWLLQ